MTCAHAKRAQRAGILQTHHHQPRKPQLRNSLAMEDESESSSRSGSPSVEYASDESAQNDHDDADNLVDDEASDAESDDDSGNSESEDDGRPNDYFDMEALESASDGGLSGSESELHYFPQFSRLPIELRHRVWEFFCPDLCDKPRVFSFDTYPDKSPRTCIYDGISMTQQTAAARTMLATHHESRVMALRFFPDTLAFDSPGVLRFRKDRDIVLVNEGRGPIGFKDVPPFHDGFRDNVVHLALLPRIGEMDDPLPSARSLDFFLHLAQFPSLKTVYLHVDSSECATERLMWCKSDLMRRYDFWTTEVRPGLGEDMQYTWSWPNFQDHPDFFRNESTFSKVELYSGISGETAEFPRLEEISNIRAGLSLLGSPQADETLASNDLNSEQVARLAKLEMWPMFSFILPYKVKEDVLDEYLRERLEDNGNYWEDEQDWWSLSDDYDSFIDDDDDNLNGGGDNASSGEEDDLAVVPLSDDVSTLEDGDRVSPFLSENGNDYHAARFSSPELERDSLGEAEASSPEVAGVRTRPSRPPKRRLVVTDSEDDDDSDGERAPKRPANRRTRVVPSESEPDDSDAGAAGPAPSGSGRVGASPDEETSDEETSDEDDTEKRPMSLVERLQLHRQENPSSPSGSDDGDSDGGASGGDYDTRGYGETDDSEAEGAGDIGYLAGDMDRESDSATMGGGDEEDSGDDHEW